MGGAGKPMCDLSLCFLMVFAHEVTIRAYVFRCSEALVSLWDSPSEHEQMPGLLMMLLGCAEQLMGH